jgi:hypothetical protein
MRVRLQLLRFLAGDHLHALRGGVDADPRPCAPLPCVEARRVRTHVWTVERGEQVAVAVRALRALHARAAAGSTSVASFVSKGASLIFSRMLSAASRCTRARSCVRSLVADRGELLQRLQLQLRVRDRGEQLGAAGVELAGAEGLDALRREREQLEPVVDVAAALADLPAMSSFLMPVASHRRW